MMTILRDYLANWKRMLGWLLTSGLLLTMFVNSRSFEQQYHNQIVGNIAALTRHDAELGEAVIKQHFNLLNNYDKLVAVSGKLQAQLAELRGSAALHALQGEPQIMAAFGKMEARAGVEQDMLERFKSSNAVLRNSLLFLPHAIEDLLHNLPPAALQRMGPVLRRLRQDVATVSTDVAALDLSLLQDDIAEISRQSAGLPPAARERLQLMLRHFQKVTELEAEADKLMRELTLSGHGEGISDEFIATYREFYAREEQRSHRYLILLFVVALAMMTYAIYAFYHMRRLNERTQRALAEVRNQKIALDEHAIVSISDMQGRITYVNRSFLETTQYSEAELLGRDHRILNSGHHSKEFFGELWATIASGKVWHGQIMNRAKDGHTYWVESTIVPFLDETGKPYQYVSVRTDITGQKAAVQEAKLAREAAEAASRAKGEFLAVMSHEIRTPMNGIIGMTDLALDTGLSDLQREYLGLVKSSADALLVIINDILDFSKIESGKMLLEQVPFDIRSLCESTTRLLAVRATEKDVRVVARVDEAIPAVLLGDPGRLRQVLTNLLGNAIKFSHHGEVTLRMKLIGRSGDKARLRIEVADQGIGIPADKMEHIFEAFSQADVSTTRQYGGTGLGLAISSQLVEAMGGKLGVESEVGRGSVFGFDAEFPVGDALPVMPAVAAPVSATAAQAAVSLNVLLAEDNEVNQILAITLLERWGHRVTLAHNGREALELSEKQAYDVILMDLQMPEMGGLEATRLIREREGRRGSHTPIVAMTANAASEDRQICLDAGMDDYISKPIAAAQLRALLDGMTAAGEQPAAAEADTGGSFDYADALMRADPDVLESIGQAFHDSCDQQLDVIAAAIADADGKTLSRRAHTLRGLAGYFNATRIENLARQIEGMAERGEWPRAGNAQRMLQGEVAQLKAALGRHLA